MMIAQWGISGGHYRVLFDVSTSHKPSLQLMIWLHSNWVVLVLYEAHDGMAGEVDHQIAHIISILCISEAFRANTSYPPIPSFNPPLNSGADHHHIKCCWGSSHKLGQGIFSVFKSFRCMFLTHYFTAL